MTEVIVIIVALAAVVALVAYNYWALGDRGAEFDLVIKRGDSLGDPQDPHSTIELNLGGELKPDPSEPPRPEPLDPLR